MPATTNIDRLSLEQLFDCGRFGRSGVAENDRGELVSIYDVPRGLACNCVCPSCRRAMVARTKDDIKAAHFAHYGTSDTPCTSAGETALHMFAKQVANDRREIFLPELFEEVDFEREQVVAARRLSFDEAVLEKRTGQIVPDVILSARGRRLIVEFKVTHECGPEKIARIRDLDIGAIEVDLSDYRGTKLKDLGEAILFRAPRKWLHNPNSKAARARAGARAHLRRAAVADEVAKLSQSYQHPSLKRDPGSGANETVARSDGLGELIGLDVNGAGCFVVDLAEWQSGVLLLVLKERAGVQSEDIVRRLAEKSWIAQWALNLSGDVEAGLRGSVANFLPPEEAIASYLEELVNQRMMVRRGDGAFLPSQYALLMVAKTREARQRPGKRFDEARALVEGLCSSLPAEEVADFNLETWAGLPVGKTPISLRAAVKAEDQRWREFVGQLRSLASSIRDRPTPELDLMGLPFDGELRRSLERKAAEEAARVEQQEKAEAQAAEARVRELRSRAWYGLEDHATDWMKEPNEHLGGRSPLEMAQIGEEELRTVKKVLGARIEADRKQRVLDSIRSAALQEVSKFAREKLGDLQAEYWMKGFHPKLNARPVEYVCDEASRDACLRLIDPKVNIEKITRGRSAR